MNIARALLIGLVLVAQVGCSKGGSGGSSDAGSVTPKAFFASWTRDDGVLSLNFTGGSFGPSYGFYFLIIGTGESCLCSSVVFSGSEANGTISASGCGHYTGPNSGTCSAFNNSGVPYTYSKAGSVLTVCDTGSCGTYY